MLESSIKFSQIREHCQKNSTLAATVFPMTSKNDVQQTIGAKGVEEKQNIPNKPTTQESEKHSIKSGEPSRQIEHSDNGMFYDKF